jgi:hypothetical protein
MMVIKYAQIRPRVKQLHSHGRISRRVKDSDRIRYVANTFKHLVKSL